MSSELESRIDAMCGRDRAWAIFFVLMLWLVVGVVLTGIYGLVTSTGVKIALIGASLLVLIFNSAAIVAMIRHYEHDKQFIYGTDIRHLDARIKR
jgi:hypothetical protein